MKGRARAGTGSPTRAKLSAEDRAFLDFVARLAVEQALHEASVDLSVVTCGAELAEEESNDNGDA